MKKLAKILALVTALVLALSCFAYAEEAVEEEEIDADAYYAVSAELYDANLGEFVEAYAAAKEAETIPERYALMAVAEAKLMESGVMFPTTSRGGNYAISRVAPRTVSSVLWGNASDRFYKAAIVDGDEFLKIMRTEEYDPDHIYDIWAKMAESPEMKALMDMNEVTGVCSRGYRERGREENV